MAASYPDPKTAARMLATEIMALRNQADGAGPQVAAEADARVNGLLQAAWLLDIGDLVDADLDEEEQVMLTPKPCPDCGNRMPILWGDALETLYLLGMPLPPDLRISCDCGMTGPIRGAKRNAIQAWNEMVERDELAREARATLDGRGE